MHRASEMQVRGKIVAREASDVLLPAGRLELQVQDRAVGQQKQEVGALGAHLQHGQLRGQRGDNLRQVQVEALKKSATQHAHDETFHSDVVVMP